MLNDSSPLLPSSLYLLHLSSPTQAQCWGYLRWYFLFSKIHECLTFCKKVSLFERSLAKKTTTLFIHFFCSFHVFKKPIKHIWTFVKIFVMSQRALIPPSGLQQHRLSDNLLYSPAALPFQPFQTAHTYRFCACEVIPQTGFPGESLTKR